MKRPPGPGEVWERLNRYVGHWALLGYGMWALRDRATGRWVGEAGVFHMKRGLGPAFDDAPEAGWMLAAHAHGRGLATEAMRCILAWADQHLGPRTVCMIDEDHAASARVAAKLGYREFERVLYEDEPVVLYERTGAAPRVG
jgi:RimJ/RimL family protein N-acetyltransferase